MVRARSAALDSPSDRDTTILLNDGFRDDSGSGSEDGSVDDSSGKDFVDGFEQRSRQGLLLCPKEFFMSRDIEEMESSTSSGTERLEWYLKYWFLCTKRG